MTTHGHTDSRGIRIATWCARVAFCAVFAINVYCALTFCLTPADYVGAYELSGVAGQVAVQGIGVAFLMWNCTYPLVIWDPRRHRVLSYVVLAQQAVGLVGETAILLGIGEGHAMLCASIQRFILFDAAGLVIMAIAALALHYQLRHSK